MLEFPLANHKRQAGECALAALGALTEESTESQTELRSLAGDKKTDWHPLNLKLQPSENTSLLDLVNSENKVVNKIIIVFTALCQEVQELDKEFRDSYLDQLILFAEGSSDTAVQDNDHLVLVSKFLPQLCDLQMFVKRCQQVFQAFVQHLGAFYNGAYSKSKSSSYFDSHLTDVMDHMGSLLLMLVTIDTIIARHETFTDYWSGYCSMINSFAVSSQFDNQKLVLLREMCANIDRNICSGNVFLDAVVPFEDSKVTEKFSKFFQEFDKYIKNCLNIVADMKSPIDPDVGDNWGRTAVLIVANMKMNHVYTAPWKSVPIKSIVAWNPTVALYGCVPWNPAAFIIKHEVKNHLLNILPNQFLEQAQSSYITNTTKYLETRLHYLTFQIFNWTLDMETEKNTDWIRMDNEGLGRIPELHCFGLRYAKKLRVLVTNLVSLHMDLGRPIAHTTVLHIFRVVELIKAIEQTFYRHESVIANNMHHTLQSTSHSILLTLKNLKAKVAKGKSSEKTVDVWSALIIAEQSLSGAITPTRLLVARIALSLANQEGIFSKEDVANLKRYLRLLTKVTCLGTNIDLETNCKFLNLSLSILSTYFSNLISEKGHLDRLQYILAALGDAATTPAEKERNHKLITNLLYDKVVKPLCSVIEENLRLHSHAYTEGSSDEFQKLALYYDMKELVDTSTLFYLTKDGWACILLNETVASVLNDSWYTLTALAPRDWQKYKEMRTLLTYKYKLTTIDDQLPRQTSHVKDVLEIMREIPTFVKDYKYNLNNQIFIQEDSNSKFLYTINIEHIVHSIQTHGTGFLSTAVNYVFQFLLAKVKVISQFLFDENIKSKLQKDLNYLNGRKETLDPKYPYSRAESFNENICKLGLQGDNSYLDLFRSTITEMGNAIGYVRLLKSGAINYIDNTASFIPNTDVDSFKKLAESIFLDDTTVETAALLDELISNVTDSATGTMDYIQMIVKHVSPALQHPRNTHLLNFYVIVPPLLVNFCQSIILAKDKMAKRSTKGAFFTDDGFAMGLAFTLSAIGVNAEFDSLHFFESIDDHFKEQLKDIKRKRESSTGDTKLEQTLSLSETRIATFKREYELLFYTLSSARVFFRNELRATAVVASQTHNPPDP